MKPQSRALPSCRSRIPAALLVLLLTIACLQAQQAGDSPVKIYILVGQSNMLGHGNMSPDTTQGTLEHVVASDLDDDYPFLVDGGGDWVIRDDVWIKDQYGNAGGLTAGYGSGANDANSPPGSNIGPELGFGHFVGDHYGNQVLLVKAAWGGKSLGADFLPPSSEGPTGFYYNEVLNLVDDAIENLGSYFADYDTSGGYEIAGFCWHQGWNDRVSGTFSGNYRTNMENFIRDIRNDLEVPDLPFVIATSAMDGNGPAAYSTVEEAQLDMATDVPDFIGNVAVVDCRQTYNGWAVTGLDFWIPAANSPSTTQGYHWNRNAKTYLHIGLAMGDAMTTLSPAPCPARLRATGGAPSGVLLNWQNGSQALTSVQVLRNGVEVTPAAPVIPATFADTAALPGVLNYELVFATTGDACDPLTVTFDGGITDPIAYRSPGGITLEWFNNMSYAAIVVRRNGVIIEAALSGSSETYTDNSPPSSGLVTYSLVPSTGTAAQTEVQIKLDPAPAGNALVYEPFDYVVAALNAQSGLSETGLTGSWNANATTLLVPGSLTYGLLPTAGASIGNLTGGSNRYGGARSISATALAANGALDNGATLWFSAVVGYDIGGNVTNSRLALALANSQFNGGNYDYWIKDEGAQFGSGIGLTLGRFGSNGKVVATQFRDLTLGTGSGTAGDALSGCIYGTQSPVLYGGGDHGLIVGKITWGSTTGALDTIELFNPGEDLVLPASPVSTLSVVVDQSTFDTITFARGDKVVLDEIRFGASYDDVIGVGGATAFETWADSAGLDGTLGKESGQTDDPDGGGKNNVYEFGLGGNPLNANDDDSLLHAFSSDIVAGGAPEGVLTILVRAGASFVDSANDRTATIDGIAYTVSGDSTVQVASGKDVKVSGTVVTDGLPPAPAGYEYASFYMDGPEGYFQVTVAPAP